jgi:hypothetical protein
MSTHRSSRSNYSERSNQRWNRVGVVAAVIGAAATVVGVVWAIVPHNADEQSSSPLPPGVTRLAADSPLRDRVLIIDTLCERLGYPSNSGWLPGQTAPGDYSGRILSAPGAAYTWSCGSNGDKLTRDQLTVGCQQQYGNPNSAAYTFDPDYAYSWVCT